METWESRADAGRVYLKGEAMYRPRNCREGGEGGEQGNGLESGQMAGEGGECTIKANLVAWK